MNGLFSVAADVLAFCDDRGWRSCLIGGIAVQRWGEPRQTRDVDLTLLTGFGDERRYVEALISNFAARIPDVEAFALDNRVVLLQSPAGVGIDIALGGLPFEERAVAEATPWDVGQGVVLRTCSAEALVVYKAFAGRPQDWIDVASIAQRQGDELDRTRVIDDLRPLLRLKDAEGDLVRLERLLDDAGR